MPTSKFILPNLGRLLCVAGASLGAIGLIGWLTSVEALYTVIPGQPAMKPNTAISLLLLGVVGAIRRPRARGLAQFALCAAAALVVLAIGLGTLLEYVLDLPLGLDQLFSLNPAGPFPGRPSPPTAAALAALAMALLAFDLPARRASEWLSVAAALIAFTAMVGQLFGAGALYRLTHATVVGVAVPTALSLFMISIGLLLQRPDAAVVRVFAAPGPGSGLLMRLAPAAILTPVGVGLIGARLLEMPGIHDIALVFAALTVATTTASLFLLSITAERLNRAHDHLEHARVRTRELIEQASDGIFIANLEGRYVDVNDAGCHMLGYEREEILGKTIIDLIPPEDAERLWASKDRMVEGNIDVSEWTLRRKDGRDLAVEVSAKILPDGRWQGIVRDITERKRAQEQLRLSEAKFSGIVSISADAIISIDENQRIILFNEGAEKIFGYSSSEVIGASLDVLIPERVRTAHNHHVELFANGRDEARRMEARGDAIYGLRRNGEEFPADAAISKLSVGGKRILTVTLRDITEQKRVENEQRLLAEAGSLLATTLDFEDTLSNIARLLVRDLSDICIIDFVGDAQDICRAKVVCRDPSNTWVCEALMRMPRERRAISEIRQPLLVEHLTPDIVRSWNWSDEHTSALQSIGPRSAVIVPMLVRGKLLGKLSLISLEAPRKFGSRELQIAYAIAQLAALSLENARLYSKAKAATKARDDVLGIVAHDLRNPLQIISTDAVWLRRCDAEAEREIGGEIGNAVHRMNRLIQDLLDVTQMEAGHLSLMQTRLHAQDVVDDLMQTQKPLAASASLELSVAIAPGLPDILADRDRLFQVFENLIGNAIKFTKPGGHITLGAEASAGEIVFSVADTGAGISENDVPHVFDRFWRGAKPARRGAGLGLPIVKGIVEAHRGHIWVRSALGKGTTVFFTIPIAQQATQDAPPSRRLVSRDAA